MRLNRLGPLAAALIGMAGISVPALLAQRSLPAPESKYVAPFYMDCGHEPPYKPQSARSRVLSSPDGKREAYAEGEVRVDGEGSCTNTSSVFVRDEGGAYRLVFLQGATEDLLGNGLRLIDWSRDGQRLLFEVLRWQYGSDAGVGSDLWIYTAGVLKAVPLRRLFRSFGDGCNTTFEPLGFSATGGVAMQFSTKQDYDVEGEILLPKCDEKSVVWIFDPVSNRLTQTSHDYAVPKWGKLN